MEEDKDHQLLTICHSISIDRDLEEYGDYYQAAMDIILERLCRDNFFKSLYSGIDLFGSIADNIKIGKPDEYDCYVFLNFGPLRVSKSNIPSAAHISIVNQSEHFKNLTDPDGYLIPRKVNSWFRDVIVRQGLSDRSTHHIASKSFELCYSVSGLAQTFEVTVDYGPRLSIDLVPSIKFSSSEAWILDRKPLEDSYWNVVPKSLSEERSFKACFTNTETYMINDNEQMRNVIKLVKKINEISQLNLKSYLIKAIFMYIDEENGPDFWLQSIYFVLIAALERMIMCFREKNLPYFWDRSDNMIRNMEPKKRKHIVTSLEDVMRKIMLGNMVDAFLISSSSLYIREQI